MTGLDVDQTLHVPTIGYLHTAAIHVATFERLTREVAPAVESQSIVDAGLLERARTHGADDAEVLVGVERDLLELTDGGASVIVCTCSTIGGTAEAVGRRAGLAVARVDRAMAERAVAISGRIVVVAALASTVATTVALLTEASAPVRCDAEVVLLPDAWERFEADDIAGYHATIAEALPDIAVRADVIVLAQASMAAAADMVELAIPVLSSPRPGVEAAVTTLNT